MTEDKPMSPASPSSKKSTIIAVVMAVMIAGVAGDGVWNTWYKPLPSLNQADHAMYQQIVGANQGLSTDVQINNYWIRKTTTPLESLTEGSPA